MQLDQFVLFATNLIIRNELKIMLLQVGMAIAVNAGNSAVVAMRIS